MRSGSRAVCFKGSCSRLEGKSSAHCFTMTLAARPEKAGLDCVCESTPGSHTSSGVIIYVSTERAY